MKHRIALLMMLLALASACRCGRRSAGAAPGQDYFVAEPVHLMIPKLPGWQEDKSNTPSDPNQGGIVLRLGREGAVVGSPRIDVVLEPAHPQPTLIEEFLRRNLQDMGTWSPPARSTSWGWSSAGLSLGATQPTGCTTSTRWAGEPPRRPSTRCPPSWCWRAAAWP